MWSTYVLICIITTYLITIPIPDGLVYTAFEDRTLHVGEWSKRLPYYFDVNSMRVTKSDGYLHFTFEPDQQFVRCI